MNRMWTTFALGVMWFSSPLMLSAAPNVVLILADDMGYGDLSCYGHPRFKTPRIDRLAEEGTRLTQFNTPAPFCAPTRASLLTGRYPTRCRFTSNPAPDGAPIINPLHLPENEILLPQTLKEAGYATGMIGKWHLGHAKVEWWPTRRGFDEYLGILYSNDMRPVQLIDGEKVVEYPVVQNTLTRRYTERALRFIERNKEKPFFLYLAHAMPHKPLAASEDFYQKSGAGLYGDAIAELDWSTGQILDKLKSLGLEKNTLVIFTSDNGPWYGGSSGGLRGMKGTSWEGGYRVPCLMKWPDHIPAGQVREGIAMMPDLYSTILASTGTKPPSDRTIDGKDLSPFLHQSKSIHDFILCQNGQQLATIRDDRWKLYLFPQKEKAPFKRDDKYVDKRAPDDTTILAPKEQYTPADYPGVLGGDHTLEGSLFDLKEDPSEQHDVSAKHPEVVKRLKDEFEKLAAQIKGP